jgi:hypothetical protein
MSENKKSGMLAQITVAVVVALAVGGSAPWWVELFFGDEESVEEIHSTDSPTGQATSPPGKETPPIRPETNSAAKPTSDFPGGSSRVYSADFSEWPTTTTGHGSVTLGFGNSYVLEPSGNTWIGPGRSIDIPALDGDFVFDVRFQIEERKPSSLLTFNLTAGGADAESVDVYFDVWDEGNVTYTLTKGRVRSGGGLSMPHGVTEATIADREQLPFALKDHDWSKGSTLTLKREGGLVQFFVNGGFVKDFYVSRFPVMKTSVGAAFESKVVITSIEARTKD